MQDCGSVVLKPYKADDGVYLHEVRLVKGGRIQIYIVEGHKKEDLVFDSESIKPEIAELQKLHPWHGKLQGFIYFYVPLQLKQQPQSFVQREHISASETDNYMEKEFEAQESHDVPHVDSHGRFYRSKGAELQWKS